MIKSAALRFVSDSEPASKQRAAIHRAHVPVWFAKTASMLDGTMIQRKSGCACGGGCPSCKDELDDLHVRTKLEISAPGDQFEQDADRMAEQVMRITEPHHPTPAFARAHDSNAQVQRKYADSADEEQQPASEDLESGLRGGGQPLSESVRRFFEPRFGRDFGGVRVHTDALAVELSQALRAEAFTYGKDIYFNAHRFAPSSTEGRSLLAHELAHTIQPNLRRGTIQRQVARDAGTPAPTPDAGIDAGTPVPCPVAPIAAITDPDALAMEAGTRVIWNHTAANLQTCANTLVGLIHGAGGTATITSAYRPQAYQDHLREVWDKARALQSHPETACNTVRAAVNAEMANHSLSVTRPVAQISNHRAGNAVDISWTLPATLTQATCQLPVPDGGSPTPPTEEECIDSLAGRAGMTHPLHTGDVPHFEV
jgi:hypothetical protein